MLFKKVVAAAALSIALIAATPAFAYEVKPGDTMYKIAKSHGIGLGEIRELNTDIENLNLIYPGQTVRTKANSTGSEVKHVSVKQTVNSSYSATATAAERDLLARLVHAEAQGETYNGKLAVAEVVLNRVKSGEFPNSITAVIYQPGQFSPIANGLINNSPTAADQQAVVEALGSGDISAGSLFFYNPKTATSRWLDGRPTVTVIGNHVFKR